MHLKPFLSGRHLEAVHAFLILKRQYNTETIQHRSPALFFRSLSRLKAANSRVSLLMNLSMEGIKPQCVLVFWVLSVLGSSYLYLVWNRSRIQSSHWGGVGGRRVSQGPFSMDISCSHCPEDCYCGSLCRKEGQALNSHKSKDFWQLPLTSKGISQSSKVAVNP